MTLLKKRASTKEELRGFKEICGNEAFLFAMRRIETLRDHFAREMPVLNLEREDSYTSGSFVFCLFVFSDESQNISLIAFHT